MIPPTFSSARWIAAPFFGGPTVMSPSPWFRCEFDVLHAPRCARLNVTALGVYEIEINGRSADSRIFAPGWTDTRKRVQFQSIDVTALLQLERNAIGAVLGDGWYCGHLGWWNRQNGGDRPALLLELTVTSEDGTELRVASGPDWRVTDGPILANDLLMGETYDARRELTNWSEVGTDDSGWRPVIVLPDPEIEISPSLDAGVKRQELLDPNSENRIENGRRRIFDFGQNFAGRIRMRIQADAGRTVQFRHSEILDAAGAPYYENLRSARATDVYTCRGSAAEHWEPHFTFHGFRYCDVSGLDPNDDLQIQGVVLHSDTPRTGHFTCSNPLLNRLYENIVWGQKSNFLEVPTDCPQRDERLGWTGDAQVFIRTACFNMDVRAFFHKWMRDVRDAQSPEGAVPAVVPHVQKLLQDPDGGPAWSDAMIICPWTIYLCYGDVEILRDNYDAMTRYVRYHANQRSRDGIRYHPGLPGFAGFGDWLALDGSGRQSGSTPHDLIGTAFLAYDLDLMRQIAQVLGRTDDAAGFEALRTRTVEAFRRRFVTQDGLLAAGTQTAYVLALHFDLLPDGLRPNAADALVRRIRDDGNRIGTGFVGTPYLLDVLESSGHLDLAYALLEREEFPSWLFPVKNGATTIWERWDGWTPTAGFQNKTMNSFNHYAYGAVGAWMVRSVAGIEIAPGGAGYRRVVFRPRPGGSITRAEATLSTAKGLLGIRWELEATSLAIHVTIPTGVDAVLDAPADYAPFEDTLTTPGDHTIRLSRRTV